MRVSGPLATSLVVAAALTCFVAVPPAVADQRIGVLQCEVAAGMGFIVGSNRALTCTYRPERGRPQYYAGTIKRFGLDIGATSPGQLEWAVVAAAPSSRGYSLAGDYAGPGAGLTIGAGLNANALVGGNGNSVSLQPLSIATQTGLNVTAGVGALTLEPVAPAVAPRRHHYHHHHHHRPT